MRPVQSLERLRAHTEKAVQIAHALVAEVREAVSRIGIMDERELIHQPPLVDITQLPNGSRIIGIDYRCVPGHSSKVIPTDALFSQAEANGEISLEKTPTIIISSSGNASIWLTKIATAKGYKVITVVPDYASNARLHALVALGAEIILVPGELGVAGLIARGERLEKELPDSKFLDQNHSADNFAAFEAQGKRVGRKLLFEGLLPTHLVAGMGTGGTLTGLIQGMRELSPDCTAVGVEVEEKQYLATEYPTAKYDLPTQQVIATVTECDSFWVESYVGASQIPGLSANIPSVNLTKIFGQGKAHNTSVDNETALRATRLLARKFHQFAGPSTGAAFAVAFTIAQHTPNSVIVLPICDIGERYEGDTWHRETRRIISCEKTETIVGSSIVNQTIVQPDYRTPHMAVHEMGGPLGTAAMLHHMEVTCRDLEVQLGLITDSKDTFGMGTSTPLIHTRYVPVGTPLQFKATIIAYTPKDQKAFLTCTVACLAQEKDGSWVVVGETTHQRCCLPIQTFRAQQLAKFAESKL
ncbi:pyridoxal-phosphate dependent enzyme [Candidatus Gracilibacteria bacterium]|nr:pyridoxal-phosphate dependent enzyme [Candidatus Gracilibacteria bacterium]